jgi:hypothetical protein
MNANEISPKANARLKRIKTVSNILMMLFAVGVLLYGLATLIAIVNWVATGSVVGDTAKTRIPMFLPKYRILANFCMVITFVLGFLMAWFGRKLFRLYGRGQLFSPENISCLRKIAWTFILSAVATALWVAIQNPQNSHGFGLDDASQMIDKLPALWGSLLVFVDWAFPALLIFFFAWIMDEGRKIQEEQELTV